MIQVFISSVQSEFAAERKALCEYIRRDPQNAPPKIVSVRCRSLLETIISRPIVSKEELARIHGISVPTLKRDLPSMRRSYDIKWVGPTKGGHWEVKLIK